MKTLSLPTKALLMLLICRPAIRVLYYTRSIICSIKLDGILNS
jgi:hypothetical protein